MLCALQSEWIPGKSKTLDVPSVPLHPSCLGRYNWIKRTNSTYCSDERTKTLKSIFGGEIRADPTEVRFVTLLFRTSLLFKLAYCILCSCGLIRRLFSNNWICFGNGQVLTGDPLHSCSLRGTCWTDYCLFWLDGCFYWQKIQLCTWRKGRKAGRRVEEMLSAMKQATELARSRAEVSGPMQQHLWLYSHWLKDCI